MNHSIVRLNKHLHDRCGDAVVAVDLQRDVMRRKQVVKHVVTGKYITAIDYKTGKIAWRHLQISAGEGSGNTGLTTTAGKLLFGGDANGNLVAYDPANGKPLWHTHLGEVSNAVETYMLDGRQYILAASGNSLYAFALNF